MNPLWEQKANKYRSRTLKVRYEFATTPFRFLRVIKVPGSKWRLLFLDLNLKRPSSLAWLFIHLVDYLWSCSLEYVSLRSCFCVLSLKRAALILILGLAGKFASFVQRNVDVHAEFTNITDLFLVYTKSSPPSILHTCRDSRAESLRHYSLEFEYLGSSERRYPGFKHGIYINWDVDRICLLKPNRFYMADGPIAEVEASRGLKVLQDRLVNMGLKYLAIDVKLAPICHWDDSQGGEMLIQSNCETYTREERWVSRVDSLLFWTPIW